MIERDDQTMPGPQKQKLDRWAFPYAHHPTLAKSHR